MLEYIAIYSSLIKPYPSLIHSISSSSSHLSLPSLLFSRLFSLSLPLSILSLFSPSLFPLYSLFSILLFSILFSPLPLSPSPPPSLTVFFVAGESAGNAAGDDDV